MCALLFHRVISYLLFNLFISNEISWAISCVLNQSGKELWWIAQEKKQVVFAFYCGRKPQWKHHSNSYAVKKKKSRNYVEVLMLFQTYTCAHARFPFHNIWLLMLILLLLLLDCGKVDIGDPKPDHFVTSYIFFAVAFCNLVN